MRSAGHTRLSLFFFMLIALNLAGCGGGSDTAGGNTPPSTDPLDNWQIRISGVTTRLNAVTYGGNKFVVVGDGGVILYSSDGVTWTPATSGTTLNLFSVYYGAGVFVATGLGTYVTGGATLTSVDGVNWVTTDSTSGGFGVTYGGSFLTTAGRSSPNGITWSTLSTMAFPDPYRITQAVGYGKGQFVVSSLYPTAHGGFSDIAVSSDLTSWSYPPPDYNGIAAMGYDTINYSYHSVAVGEPACVIAGYGLLQPKQGSVSTFLGNAALILSSPNCLDSWISQALISTNGLSQKLNGVTYGKITYVSVGQPGVILSSPNGTTWTTRISPTSEELRGVAFGNDAFVAVGTNGVILHTVAP